MAQFLHIGTVRRAHGLRGQVKVALDNADSEVLDQVDHLWLGVLPTDGKAPKDGKSGLRKWSLSEARPMDQGVYIVTLDGVSDRTAAESLQLQDVYADRTELPELSEDEVYQADLIGCAVKTLSGEEVGIIRELELMNGNPLLVIERAGRADALVPFVPQIITNIDLATRTVQIDPPEGLLDLDRPGD